MISKEVILEAFESSPPPRLKLPMTPRVDHADHIIQTALSGWVELAADHILHPEMGDALPDVIASFTRRTGLIIREERLDSNGGLNRALRRARLYAVSFEMVFNLAGCESRWALLDPESVRIAMESLTNSLEEWESIERKELGSPLVLEAVIEHWLRKLEMVNKGKSMVAAIASDVRSRLDSNRLARSFIGAVVDHIATNFYRRAYEAGLCKFGNDYALGLRFLRHLGFVQVSTNPALAARAYDDIPYLWKWFEDYAKSVLSREHPEWFENPEKYADELAMEATRYALLDNFYVFRVPFVLSNYHDGLVSYQLNPLIANDVEKSVEAVRKFVVRLERDLKVYDEYLWWGYNVPEKGRPNLVVKVAAGYPAAIDIAERINEMGVGQNITVSYTLSQEILVGFAAIKGMAKALRKGITPTQTYDTNMSGRLEDHLREVAAAKLLLKGLNSMRDSEKWKLLDELANQLGVDPARWNEAKKRGLQGAVDYLVSRRVLGRNLCRSEFIKILVKAGVYSSENEATNSLKELEDAIKLSGTIVAKRVYEVFFAPWNRGKWVEYLARETGLSREEAEFVLDRIDLLPASKRKPGDTLLTLASRNVTNTEFPDHQLNVVNEVADKRISLEELRDSILKPVDEKVLKILMEFEDFVKAYEASPEVNELLERVGIPRVYGCRGLRVDEWSNYGPCVKTLNQFTNAYLEFRAKVVDLAKKLSA